MTDVTPLPFAQRHRRRDARLRIRQGLPALLVTLDGQVSATLLDLSQSGMQLYSAHPLRRGHDLIIWWLGFEAFGEVVWTGESEAGVEFHELLPPVVLLHTRDQIDQGQARNSTQSAYDHARAWYHGYR